ncbi:MAG: bifunctional phosphopantothenoylcysteine decarboxylase/phosphopantothenate--cysteine ligase CoaBC [Candidatus Dormibacteria bacterium]
MGDSRARFAGRRIVVHVCGGIAAVKVPALVTRLRQEGAEVRVAMTPTATTMVSPISLQALSGHPVALTPATGIAAAEGLADGPGMAHLDLASWADCHLVVPATAATISRLAVGMADDVVGATLLATAAPVLLAPAMETAMWGHPATRANLATLRDRGVAVVGPSSGRLASGRWGEGRMAEPEQILQAAGQLLGSTGPLAGVEVLVTSGGTREPVDPVRYLGNRSSGRMGWALGFEAARRGARVHLVTTADQPFETPGVTVVRVETAAEMLAASLDVLPRVGLVLMAAAVADYRVASPSPTKLHRREQPNPELRLVANVDVLAEILARRPPGCRVVGFAAETESVRERGMAKLREKGCDMLVANPVSGAHSAMGGDHAEALVLIGDGREVELRWAPKEEIARGILDLAQELLEPAQGALRQG